MSNSDIDLIRAALAHSRDFARGLRYGGLMMLYQECLAALDALARVEHPDLFQWRARADEDVAGAYKTGA